MPKKYVNIQIVWQGRVGGKDVDKVSRAIKLKAEECAGLCTGGAMNSKGERAIYLTFCLAKRRQIDRFKRWLKKNAERYQLRDVAEMSFYKRDKDGKYVEGTLKMKSDVPLW